MKRKPRLLMVARTRYLLPLPETTGRKFAALRERFDLRVLATSADGAARDDGVFHLVGRLPVLDGPLFYVLLPFRVRRLARSHRPEALVTQSPYEAALVRWSAPGARLVVEVHGDWRTAPRLYGSPLRRLLAPLTDRVGALGVRRADAVRTISAFTSGLVRGLGVEPAAEFAAFTDLDAFAGEREPLPAEPRVLFVGVLERYKNIEVLAAAWRRVAARRPGSQLHLVGSGTQAPVVETLADVGVEWQRRIDAAEVAIALDRARALILPSAIEGLGRVVIEAFMRGRAVVGTRSGGIPDIVEDGVNGLLVEPGDASALAAAIERILDDDDLASRLGAAAGESAARWVASPAEYADRMRALVDGALERSVSPGSGGP
ncbi:MAG TPA: glycosyltransferase family 4 protein [Gaiellaceae bacterium]|nr:glycosyltransferase family 4 protein [Gaiellaceae bacterium]